MTELQRPRVPWYLRDPKFQERMLVLAELHTRGGSEAERAAVMSVPLVAARTFGEDTVFTHCPLGDEDEHRVLPEPVNHDGRPHVARGCRWCGSSWLEPLP